MVGSIDPRCEIFRGTHWPVEVARLYGTRVAENHLGPRSSDRINRPDIWMQAIRSDQKKTLVARGPSTYGSRLKAGTTEGLCLTPQPRSAIEPGEIAIIIFRRLRAHDRITEAGVLACGMIDVLADGAG